MPLVRVVSSPQASNQDDGGPGKKLAAVCWLSCSLVFSVHVTLVTIKECFSVAENIFRPSQICCG